MWGLPCPPHCCCGGALLPHLFTLTPPPMSASVATKQTVTGPTPRLTTAAGRYVFCGTFRPSGLNLTSRTLSGTPLYGVRTFLPAQSRKSLNHVCSYQNGRGDRPVQLPTRSLYAKPSDQTYKDLAVPIGPREGPRVPETRENSGLRSVTLSLIPGAEVSDRVGSRSSVSKSRSRTPPRR